jgi:hypothetical protein
MKTKLLFLSAIFTFCSIEIQAQNRTQINALNSEISANLDLKAVASVFGESENLEDFESRLNDPKLQLSNLDLNYDNQVDYLRVVESIENQNHIILIQAVINRDLYQDIATIDVDKDYYNNVTIQIIGNTNLYGTNYIFEPTYYSRPRLLSLFGMQIIVCITPIGDGIIIQNTIILGARARVINTVATSHLI